MLWNKKAESDDKLPDLPYQARQMGNNRNQVIENEEEHIESIKTSEKQSLPSFPDNLADKGFSQAAIKEAVSNEDEKIPLPPTEEEEVNFLAKDLKNQNQEMAKPPVKNTFIQSNPFLNESIATKQKTAEPPIVAKIKSENKPMKLVPVQHDYPDDAPHPPVQANPKIEKKADMPQIPQIRKTPPQIVQKDNFESSEDEFAKPQEKTTDVFVKIDKFYSAKKALAAIKQDVKEIESLLLKIRETKMKEERELADWEKNILLVKNEISTINDSLFEKSI